MIKIAICDDSNADIKLIEKEIINYLCSVSVEYDLDIFTNPVDLICEIQENNSFDIYFLDVSMPEKNGFELAEEIRKHEENSVIIFLTSHSDFATKGYKSNALRYIIKSKMSEELPEALKTAISNAKKHNERYIIFRRYNEYTRIPVSQIICVSRVARQLKVQTLLNGTIADNRGIGELYSVINDSRFIFTDRSCFVNTDYIVSLTGESIILKNNENLPVSRRLMKNVKETILDTWQRNN